MDDFLEVAVPRKSNSQIGCQDEPEGCQGRRKNIPPAGVKVGYPGGATRDLIPPFVQERRVDLPGRAVDEALRVRALKYRQALAERGLPRS